MPRIADQYVDCAVYVYSSEEDAQNGVNRGGSGFIATVPLRDDLNARSGHPYIVTNLHVVEKAGNPVIRLNRKDGSPECISTRANEWKFHVDGDDIAVLPFSIEQVNLRYSAIPLLSFVTKDLVRIEDVGIGDDTVMIGRFINHEGRQKNAPAVRFGNIAMMPTERIKTDTGFLQESYLIETRSLPFARCQVIVDRRSCCTHPVLQMTCRSGDKESRGYRLIFLRGPRKRRNKCLHRSEQ
jgi:hypothetical protein